MEEKNKKSIEIVPPEGFVFDSANWEIEDGKVILYVKEEKKEPVFSKTWEEFCDRNNCTDDEAYFDAIETIKHIYTERRRIVNGDKTIIPEKFTGPMLALMQLLTIREKEYTKEWEPDWNDNNMIYHCVTIRDSHPILEYNTHYSHVLSFPTEELACKFRENWKDLIEIAKPLL